MKSLNKNIYIGRYIYINEELKIEDTKVNLLLQLEAAGNCNHRHIYVKGNHHIIK